MKAVIVTDRTMDKLRDEVAQAWRAVDEEANRRINVEYQYRHAARVRARAERRLLVALAVAALSVIVNALAFLSWLGGSP